MRLYPVIADRNHVEKEQILIIDSEWNILKLLYALLSVEYEVVVKTSSVDAFHWLVNGNKKPALIITEYKLPRIDGVLFIKHLKYSGLFKDIPVIILSDADGIETKSNGLSFYAGAVISKPFNPSFLIYRINTLINEYKSTMA